MATASNSSCQNPMCMTVLNKSNQQSVVYIGTSTSLSVQLINETGDDITLQSGDNAAKISLYLPVYYSKAALGNMNIKLDGWGFSHGSGGYSLDLVYQGDSDGTWKQGSTNAISFDIDTVLTNAQAATGKVQANLSNMKGNSKFESTLFAPLSLEKAPVVGNPKLTDYLQVTLESNRIYVSDPDESAVTNTLFLNVKNKTDKPLYQGTGSWPVNPVVNVSFLYGSTAGALAPDNDKKNPQTGSAWNITGSVAISEGNKWAVTNPNTSGQADSPVWQLQPQATGKGIIGTGAAANITFEFGNIISLLPPGHTQMQVQFASFPYNEQKNYDDHTYVLDVVKLEPKPGILKFTPVGSTILAWEPGTSDPNAKPNAVLNWQVISVAYVQLSWLGHCGSQVVLSSKKGTVTSCDPSDKYPPIRLNEDKYAVDLQKEFPDNVIMNLDVFDGEGNNVGHQQITFQFSKVITVGKFAVNILSGLAGEPEVNTSVQPKELIQDQVIKLQPSGSLISPNSTQGKGEEIEAQYLLNQLAKGQTIDKSSFFNDWSIVINRSDQSTYPFAQFGKVVNAFPKTTFTDGDVELYTSIGLHNDKGSKLQLDFNGDGKTLTLRYIDLFTSNEYRTVSKLAYTLSGDGFTLDFKDNEFVMASNGKGYYKGLSFSLSLSVVVSSNSLKYSLTGKATASNANGNTAIDVNFGAQAERKPMLRKKVVEH